MVDKIFVKPDEVRGLGNIVSPSKTLEDFSVYGCSLSFEDDVYTMAYNSTERVFLWTPSGDYNYGEQIELSAGISSQVAGLTMQFFDGETLIAEGVTDSHGEAIQYITSLTLGSHTITAKCKGITSTSSSVVNIVAEFDGFEIIETSNKTIFSAYDEDVAVFHVQLTLDGEPVAKQGVSVNWYKDNVLVSTKSTMSSGWCEFGYDAVGAGDITFRADVNVNGSLVSKIFVVEDCLDYQAMTDNSKQSHWTIPSAVTSSSTFGYSSNGWKFGNASSYSVISLNNNLSIPCVIEFYISSVENNHNYQPIFVLKDGTTTIIAFSGAQNNNTSFMGDSLGINTNGSTSVRIELNTNEQKLYFNDVLKSTKTKALPSTSPLEFHTGSNRWIEIKDFKIKPL